MNQGLSAQNLNVEELKGKISDESVAALSERFELFRLYHKFHDWEALYDIVDFEGTREEFVNRQLKEKEYERASRGEEFTKFGASLAGDDSPNWIVIEGCVILDNDDRERVKALVQAYFVEGTWQFTPTEVLSKGLHQGPASCETEEK